MRKLNERSRTARQLARRRSPVLQRAWDREGLDLLNLPRATMRFFGARMGWKVKGVSRK